MNQRRFILASLSELMNDVSSATLAAGGGIESYPLCDYVMQSVFLKMTGALEQKMKCICWEIASIDYDYRYYRYTKNRLGECSSYQEKNEIFKDIVGQIDRLCKGGFDPTLIGKLDILAKTSDQVARAFSGSNLLIWAQKSYCEFTDIWHGVSDEHFIFNEKNLFTKKRNLKPGDGVSISLEEIYTGHLYRHRNRVAHNTFSFQQNLPTLKTLLNEVYKYDNYFIYFSILILIDNIFIRLFEIYLELVRD